jgi:hypothetical protein
MQNVWAHVSLHVLDPETPSRPFRVSPACGNARDGRRRVRRFPGAGAGPRGGGRDRGVTVTVLNLPVSFRLAVLALGFRP